MASDNEGKGTGGNPEPDSAQHEALANLARELRDNARAAKLEFVAYLAEMIVLELERESKQGGEQ